MTNILFTIQIRLGSNIRNIEIKEGDTIRSLVSRLSNTSNKQSVATLESKILGSLTKIKNSPSTEMPLSMKIAKFIGESSGEGFEQRKIRFLSQSE